MAKTTEYLDNGDSLVVKQTIDGVVDLLDYNHALRESKSHGDGDMKLVGHIPGEVLQQYCYTHNVPWDQLFTDPAHIKRIMNDPDLAYFRIAPGKV